MVQAAPGYWLASQAVAEAMPLSEITNQAMMALTVEAMALPIPAIPHASHPLFHFQIVREREADKCTDVSGMKSLAPVAKAQSIAGTMEAMRSARQHEMTDSWPTGGAASPSGGRAALIAHCTEDFDRLIFQMPGAVPDGLHRCRQRRTPLSACHPKP